MMNSNKAIFDSSQGVGLPLTTPIVFIIFNRPDKARETFAAIAKVRPKKLLVIADGPRSRIPGEDFLCQQTRQIIDGVDWDCEVLKNYSDINLGCRERLASGLDWAFENVPEAIILEDDCLPAPSFFQFCNELLAYYRDDERVGMISGDNFQNGVRRGGGDYYFSRYCHIWGWATWARAWKKYDVHASTWPQLKSDDWLKSLGFHGSENRFWTRAFDRVYSKSLNTWDYQWTLSCWLNNMVSIIPNVNLISNIGFDDQATHTTSESIYAGMATGDLQFPLKHPTHFAINQDADFASSKSMFSASRLKRAFNKMQSLFGVRL